MLAGCGFSPLYSGYRDGRATSEMPLISISGIDGRLGHRLRNYLQDQINPQGRPTKPSYRLQVTLSEFTTLRALLEDETATRANLTLTARYVLFDTRADRPISSGEASVVSSFNFVQSDFAKEMAEQDARDSAARLISEDITNQLAVYFVQRQERRR